MNLHDAVKQAKTPFQLIDLIDEALPCRTPSLSQTDNEVRYNAGKRSLIDDLLIIKARLEKETPT